MGIIDKACSWLVNRYPDRARTIYRDGQPYLLRFYLTKPRVSGEHTEESPEKFGIYLHHFHQGDLDKDLHNHPWEWALSFIIAGSYTEEREDGYHLRKAGRFNFIRHGTFHRVTLNDQQTNPVWTIFTVGPRVTSWGFKSPKTGEFWNWKTYLSERGERV